MKAGSTGYLKIKLTALDMSVVSTIIFTMKSHTDTLQKTYPTDVTYSDGVFKIALTQAETIKLVGYYDVEAQINLTDGGVTKSEKQRSFIKHTLATTLMTGNTPAELSDVDLEVEEIQIVTLTPSYNDLTSKPSINSVTLSGNKTASDLGLASTSDIPDVSGLASKSYVDNMALKTINGESIKGSGNIVIQGGSGDVSRSEFEHLKMQIDGLETTDVIIESKNKLNTEASTLSVYIQGVSGRLGSSENYDTSDFIDISKFQKSVCVSPRVYARLFYDANKTPIDGTFYRGVVSNAVVEIPSDAKFVRISYPKSNLSAMQVEDNDVCSDYVPYYKTVSKALEDGVNCLNADTKKAVLEINGNILYGKKWCVVGDSFTHGGTFSGIPSAQIEKFNEGRFAGEYKIYPYLIAERNNMQIQKMFESGRTLGNPMDGSFTNCFTIEGNYDSIDEDVDYITIYLGINDYHHSSLDSSNSNSDGEDSTGMIELGTPTDTEPNTFYGAWNFVLPYLMGKHQMAKIGIIVTNGIQAYPQYRNATIEIAKKYGLAYIDLNGDERTPAMHRTSNSDIPSNVKTILNEKWRCTESNTHPNFKAHAFESTIIENFLRSL